MCPSRIKHDVGAVRIWRVPRAARESVDLHWALRAERTKWTANAIHGLLDKELRDTTREKKKTKNMLPVHNRRQGQHDWRFSPIFDVDIDILTLNTTFDDS